MCLLFVKEDLWVFHYSVKGVQTLDFNLKKKNQKNQIKPQFEIRSSVIQQTNTHDFNFR